MPQSWSSSGPKTKGKLNRNLKKLFDLDYKNAVSLEQVKRKLEQKVEEKEEKVEGNPLSDQSSDVESTGSEYIPDDSSDSSSCSALSFRTSCLQTTVNAVHSKQITTPAVVEQDDTSIATEPNSTPAAQEPNSTPAAQEPNSTPAAQEPNSTSAATEPHSILAAQELNSTPAANSTPEATEPNNTPPATEPNSAPTEPNNTSAATEPNITSAAADSNSTSSAREPTNSSDQMEPDSTSAAAEPNSTSTCQITVMTVDTHKIQYCIYCSESKAKIPRHLRDVHKEETEVAKYMAEKDEQSQKNMLILLRNKGNHRHNTEVIRQNKGVIIVVYRPPGSVQWENYIPCQYCYGYYVKGDLWKHALNCPLAPKDQKKHSRHVEAGRLLLPSTPGVSASLNKMLAKMKSDAISRAVKGDSLILWLGEKRYMKHGHDKEQHSNIRNTLREVGRLLIQLRLSNGSPSACLSDFIDPTKFKTVVDSVKAISGFSSDTNLMETPSLALKIGHSLNKCAKILKGHALEQDNGTLKAKSEGFMELYEMKWSDEVSSAALRSLSEAKRNKVQLIPLTSDCLLLTNHVKAVADNAVNALTCKPEDTSAWSELAHAVLSWLILFNRRRQGEMSKMKLQDFTARHTPQHNDLSEALSPMEKALMKAFFRVEIIGKRGRVVPVLLTHEMKACVDKLIETREAAGITPNNEFVFARAHHNSLGHIRGCDAMREASERCGAKHPELIRSTKLRKQIGTLSQILNLKQHELDMLARFLGHDINVHREFYRLPEETLQVAKVSKLLLKLERGDFVGQKGLTLEEITVDVTEEIGFEAEESDGDSEESDSIVVGRGIGIASDSDTDPDEVPGTVVKRRKISAKVPWSDEERAAVMRHFSKEMLLSRLPGKAAIERCISIEPCLKDRTWKNVKDHIRNKIKRN